MRPTTKRRKTLTKRRHLDSPILCRLRHRPYPAFWPPWRRPSAGAGAGAGAVAVAWVWAFDPGLGVGSGSGLGLQD